MSRSPALLCIISHKAHLTYLKAYSTGHRSLQRPAGQGSRQRGRRCGIKWTQGSKLQKEIDLKRTGHDNACRQGASCHRPCTHLCRQSQFQPHWREDLGHLYTACCPRPSYNCLPAYSNPGSIASLSMHDALDLIVAVKIECPRLLFSCHLQSQLFQAVESGPSTHLMFTFQAYNCNAAMDRVSCRDSNGRQLNRRLLAKLRSWQQLCMLLPWLRNQPWLMSNCSAP